VDSHWLRFVVGVDMSVASDLTAEQVAKADIRVKECLRWLWEAIVWPVLTRIGFTSPPPDQTLRRMWWLPSGYLNFLPLHAASGWNDVGVTVSALDLVISSYTPTIRSLIRAKEARQKAKSPVDLLVVAMPNTPGMPELPGARRDVEFLKHEFSNVITLINEDARKDEILGRLSDYPWIHFSCHANNDRTNPSASALFVAGATELTVHEVSEQRVNGELAFLAACRTSQAGMALVDEAIHLAAAFQLAGYRHVLAAMWPIADAEASSVCRLVYSEISRDNTRVEHSAAIVHDAVQYIRAQWPDDPVLWASYIHVGP
jgi:CHAT domain-containing protein